MIGEQAASERSEQATCRGYYILLYCLLLHITQLSVMSGFLSTWMGLLSDRVGLVSNGVGLFLGERILENMPTPSLSCHLSSSPMGIF